MKKKILITGAAGFIGTNLALKLHKEGDVELWCVDNLSSSSPHNFDALLSLTSHVEIIDVCSDGFLAKYSDHFWDNIYHLACPASPVKYASDPIATLRTCFVGTENVLQVAAASAGCKMFFSSTSEVYGDPKVNPQSEDYNGNVTLYGSPRACYDEGKRVAEALCYEYLKRGVDVRVGRLFNTYGPHMAVDDGRVVSNFIVSKMRGQPLTVHGHGDQTRSFCYIDDMLTYIDALMSVDRSYIDGPVNLGTDNEVSILDLVRLISRDYQHVDAAPCDPAVRRPWLGKLKLIYGGELPTPTPLVEGLERTWNYFNKIVDGGGAPWESRNIGTAAPAPEKISYLIDPRASVEKLVEALTEKPGGSAVYTDNYGKKINIGEMPFGSTHRVETHIYVTARFIAFHAWPQAPDSVAFLRNSHRHQFHVKASLQVSHEDRDLEFFIVQRKLQEFLDTNYENRDLGPKSCETMAKEILDCLYGLSEGSMSVEVSEDGENGALVNRFTH